MLTPTAKIGQQYFKFEELVKYEAEVAEEDGLNSLFHKFISNYQKVYEQGSDNGNQDDDDTGIVFTDKLLSFVIVIEIVILHSLKIYFFLIRFM